MSRKVSFTVAWSGRTAHLSCSLHAKTSLAPKPSEGPRKRRVDQEVLRCKSVTSHSPKRARRRHARFGACATRKGCGPRPCRSPSKRCQQVDLKLGHKGDDALARLYSSSRGSPRGRGPRWTWPCSDARRLRDAGRKPCGRKVVVRSGFEAGGRATQAQARPRGGPKRRDGRRDVMDTKVIRARV